MCQYFQSCNYTNVGQHAQATPSLSVMLIIERWNRINDILLYILYRTNTVLFKDALELHHTYQYANCAILNTNFKGSKLHPLF